MKMSQNVLLVGVLSTLVLIIHAAPSAEETALRNAILSTGPSTYTLTKDILLSQDLPPLADGKNLIVRSAAIAGAPFKIDGQNKYRIFQTRQNGVQINVLVSLTLSNIVLTRSPTAVDLYGVDGPPFTELRASKVRFIKNTVALQLYIVNAVIDTSEFTSQSRYAVQIDSEEGLGDDVKFTGTTFSKNAGAINVRKFSSITVDKCKFDQNSKTAVFVDRGSATLANSAFTSNNGGAIGLSNAGLSGSGLLFKNNVAGSGGAVALFGASRNVDDIYSSEASFKSSTFIGNKAKKFGGAFLLNDYGIITFCKSTFSGNVAGGVANDGYVLGSLNEITVTPGSATPKVTVAPGAQLTPGTGTCN